MPYCEDCGTKILAGVCPNCQEELYIWQEQMDGDDRCKASKEFSDKVDSQLQNSPKTK